MIKRTCKIFAACLVVLLILSCAAVFGSEPFSDVNSGHWAYQSVKAMEQQGIITGYPDGTFKPSETVTFGEFIKMTVIAAGKEDPGAFGQDEEGYVHWAQNYYQAALEAGFFASHEIAVSMLKENIPREYMALLISGSLGDVEVEDYSAVLESIADIDARSPHEFEIVKVYGLGILSGYPDGSFQPDGTLTRAEAASVIERFMNPDKRLKPDLEGSGAQLKVVQSGDIEEFMAKEDAADIYTPAPIKKYIIVEDASPFKMELKESGKYKWIHVPAGGPADGSAGLIKDGKVARDMEDGWYNRLDGSYDLGYIGDIKNIDYISFSPMDDEGVLILVVNPFK